MNDGDMTVGIAVRVGIAVGRHAVGGPTRMGDALRPFDDLTVDGPFQIGDFTDLPSHFDMMIMIYGDPCGIISAIFQFFQSADQKWQCLFFTDASGNTAHKDQLLSHSSVCIYIFDLLYFSFNRFFPAFRH